MKTIHLRIFLSLLCAVAMLTPIAAQEMSKTPLALTITAVKKRLEIERGKTDSTKTTTEEWAYIVSIKNGTFTDVADLTVQYRLYMKDDNNKQTSSTNLPLRKQEGSESIAALPKTKAHEFTTSTMKIETSDLRGGWSYTDGSKNASKDSLYGIWIRVLKDNQIVTEMVNPPILKTKAKW